jgi:nuclear pore complex protein Nup155
LDLFCLQTDVFSVAGFEFRFYEAVVRLPLQRAQALDSNAGVINGQIDARHHDSITAQRVQCYEIVMNALRTLKGAGRSGKPGPMIALDPASRSKCIKQIIQLSVQWPDTAFHEHLYRTLIELGLDNELLEYGGSDLVAFLQSACRKHQEEVIPKNQLVLLEIYLLCWLNWKLC